MLVRALLVDSCLDSCLSDPAGEVDGAGTGRGVDVLSALVDRRQVSEGEKLTERLLLGHLDRARARKEEK